MIKIPDLREVTTYLATGVAMGALLLSLAGCRAPRIEVADVSVPISQPQGLDELVPAAADMCGTDPSDC